MHEGLEFLQFRGARRSLEAVAGRRRRARAGGVDRAQQRRELRLHPRARGSATARTRRGAAPTTGSAQHAARSTGAGAGGTWTAASSPSICAARAASSFASASASSRIRRSSADSSRTCGPRPLDQARGHARCEEARGQPGGRPADHADVGVGARRAGRPLLERRRARVLLGLGVLVAAGLHRVAALRRGGRRRAPNLKFTGLTQNSGQL
jgi:hypothetical protein